MTAAVTSPRGVDLSVQSVVRTYGSGPAAVRAL